MSRENKERLNQQSIQPWLARAESHDISRGGPDQDSSELGVEDDVNVFDIEEIDEQNENPRSWQATIIDPTEISWSLLQK
jgi:hypothetical protein